MNRIILIGRLTRDPESKYTPGGHAIAQFRIAVDRPFKNQETGEKETDFIDIITWRKTAEFVTQYISKGRLVAVEGRLQMRSWVAQDGTKRTAYEVIADNVQSLDRAPEAGAQYQDAGAAFPGPAPTTTAAPAGRAPASPTPMRPFDPNDNDNDPFADE
jgi:single-strand DNA-binding protein